MENINKIIKDIDTVLTKEVGNFDKKLIAILKKIQRQLELSGLYKISEEDALNFDYEFQKILTDTGYYDLVDNFINHSYDKTYTQIQSLFESTGLAFAYTDADVKILQDLKNLDLEFFKQIGNNAASQMKRDIFKYSLSNLTAEEMATNIKASLAFTELSRYSKTYAETMIGKYNQSVIDIKSEGVENEVYIYRGVDDFKNRPFCQCLLDKHQSYSKADAIRIKNDKRRQYNCRHIIVPVSKEWAIQNNYTFGGFTC